ncbi:MAG: CPBP family intramembrane glutamic endopeptidase [Armatimonadota bacterium]|nr:CPBP family intramembrane metalloprotease [bacterium]
MGKGKNKFVTFVVSVVGAAVVAALYYFNKNAISYNQYLVGNLIGIFWIPMLSILFLFGEEPSSFGFSLGSWRRIWIVLVIAFAALFPVMLYVSHWQGFQNYYPLFKWYPEFKYRVFADYPRLNPFTTAPMTMLFAEASYGMYMFCWEFFFRGYLLFGLHRSIGWSAILVQAIAFGILHAGKPGIEIIASFGAGVILGIIALNAKSFMPGFVLHWVASITFDIMIVAGRPHSS